MTKQHSKTFWYEEIFTSLIGTVCRSPPMAILFRTIRRIKYVFFFFFMDKSDAILIICLKRLNDFYQVWIGLKKKKNSRYRFFFGSSRYQFSLLNLKSKGKQKCLKFIMIIKYEQNTNHRRCSH